MSEDTPEENSADDALEDAAEQEAAAEETISEQMQEPQPEPELMHGVPVSWSRGQTVLHPGLDDYVDLVTRLRDEGYWICTDLCAVDYLGNDDIRELPIGVEPERYEVVVLLHNHAARERVRIRLQVPASEPTVPSLFGIHPSVHNPEREAFDMFGIVFEGHPDLSRILMPDDWDGHPLRKDYAVGQIPVQFKGVSSSR